MLKTFARPQTKPIQTASEGVGPLYHRRYWVNFICDQTPEALMQTIKADFVHYTPAALLAFEKTQGRPWQLRVGDEYRARLMGGLKGTVRVIESTPLSFKFQTLEGHPEAGQIQFFIEVLPDLQGGLRFGIESWARSRDGLVQFAYEGLGIGGHLRLLGIGRWLQQRVWQSFCLRVVRRCEGRQLDGVQVRTQVLEEQSNRQMGQLGRT